MRSLIISFLALITYLTYSSFCGFYVAKADAKLFNKGSQVILCRSGEQTSITMGSDFKGDVKDFAMVIPVPNVIKKEQIRIAKPEIFEKLDAYTGPRLVEYQDAEPCQQRMMQEISMAKASRAPMAARAENLSSLESEDKYHVKIEASYTVEEYDIIVLSAEQSGGLERWLNDNGYKIPAGANEVLEPYIKSNLKFFVVKVNMAEYKKLGKAADANGYVKLRPIQLTFKSPKFMLPIRLGMANADGGDQDLIIYSFSDQGRIESTNYRTVNIPTDREIPEFTKNVFGEFYQKLFAKAWKRENKNAVFLEYGWDISSSNYVHCDPCSTTPPTYAELREAGVFWVTQGNSGSSDYQGNVYTTRLHVRYNRVSFPQDLMFQSTPNKAPFQGRYVMRHPARELTCSEAKPYITTLVDRRKRELDEFVALTGWMPTGNEDYVSRYAKLLGSSEQPRDPNGYLNPLPDTDDDAAPLFPFGGDNNTPTPPTLAAPQSPYAYWMGGAMLLLAFGMAATFWRMRKVA